MRLERSDKIDIVKNIIKHMGFDSENIFNNDKTLYKSKAFESYASSTLTYIIDHKDNKNFSTI